jgi:hypothetical protein
MSEPKYKILQEVAYKTTVLVDAEETTVRRKGVIKSIQADL